MHYNFDKNDWLWKHRYNLLLIIVLFLLYMIVYLPMCARHGVAVEETQFTHNHLPVQLCNGRWGIYLFRTLTHSGEFLPYGAGILAGIFISLALWVQIKLFNINQFSRQIIYALFYFSCTQWAYQLRYSNQSHAIALGILCISMAAYIQVNYSNNIWKMLISSLLICFTISTYQTLTLYYGVLIVAAFLNNYIHFNKQAKFRQLLYIFISAAFAFILYSIIGKLLICLLQPPAAMLMHVKEYQDSMSALPDFLNATLVEKIRILAHFGIKTPIKDVIGSVYRGQWIFSTAILPFMFLLCHIIFKQEKIKFIYILIPFIILLLPFWGDVLLICEAPMRAQIAEPISLASLWAIALPFMKYDKKWVQSFIFTFGCVIFIYSTCRVSTISRDEHWAWERSKEEVLAMYSRAQQVGLQAGYSDCPIYILGNISISTDHLFDLEDIGFCPDSAYPNVIKFKEWTEYYLYYLRLPRLKHGNKEDTERHREAYENMPSWPSDGSIKAHKGEVIIRIGQETPGSNI